MQTATATRPTNGLDKTPKLFVIETGIPVPKRGQPPSEQIKESLTRLTYALNNMKPLQSIVVRNVSATTVRKHIREELPELKVRLQTIDKDKGFVRLWLLA